MISRRSPAVRGTHGPRPSATAVRRPTARSTADLLLVLDAPAGMTGASRFRSHNGSMAPWQRFLEGRDAERAWKVINDIAQGLRPTAENIDPAADPGVA